MRLPCIFQRTFYATSLHTAVFQQQTRLLTCSACVGRPEMALTLALLNVLHQPQNNRRALQQHATGVFLFQECDVRPVLLVQCGMHVSQRAGLWQAGVVVALGRTTLLGVHRLVFVY
jgi:hypothetical protein